jgi:hypothetical protein
VKSIEERARSMGILAFLDPEVRAHHEAKRSEEERRRDYAIERIAALSGCRCAAARAWLDDDDAEAIAAARRRMRAGAYTDIAVDGWLH